MLIAQFVRLEELEGCVLRLTDRVLDLQRQVLALAHLQPHEDITEVSNLSAEVARLQRVLEGGFDFLRREIRGSSETVSTQIGALMQFMTRALEQLDTIRLILLAKSISFQDLGPSRPFARAGTSTCGRGRSGRGRARGFDPESPHHISDFSDSDASSHDIY